MTRKRKEDINNKLSDYEQGLISLNKTLEILDMEDVLDELARMQKQREKEHREYVNKMTKLVGEALQAWKRQKLKK